MTGAAPPPMRLFSRRPRKIELPNIAQQHANGVEQDRATKQGLERNADST
jgi:hypothetical protein